MNTPGKKKHPKSHKSTQPDLIFGPYPQILPKPESWVNLSTGDPAPRLSQSQLPSPRMTPEQVLGVEVNQNGALPAFPQLQVARHAAESGHLPEHGCSAKRCGHTEVHKHQATTPSLARHLVTKLLPSTARNPSNTELSSTEFSCHILQSKSTRNKPILPPHSLLLPSLQTCPCSLSVGQTHKPKAKA